MIPRIAIVICFFLLIVGCGTSQPIRIDGDSGAAFERSLQAMERSLTREQQIGLSVAILRIRMAGMESAEEAMESTGGQPILPIDVKDRLAGLTYEEILALADKSGVGAEVIH